VEEIVILFKGRIFSENTCSDFLLTTKPGITYFYYNSTFSASVNRSASVCRNDCYYVNNDVL